MKLSVVATLFYSEKFIREFYSRMVTVVRQITNDYEIIFVNDGSPDQSKRIVLELQSSDPNIVLIELTRNFGHHKAIMTGLAFSTGEYVFLIDSDLEEDPELLNLFWDELKASPGIDVVFGVQKKRKGDWFEKISGKIYYGFFKKLTGINYPANTLTSRLMTRRYLEGLKKFPEKEFDIWSLFILTGFYQKGLTVNKSNKGSSTYTIIKKIRMAVDSITSLTTRPLYFISLTGMAIAFAALIYAIYISIQYFMRVPISEGAAMIISLWFIGGMIMLSLGMIGIYLSKMYLELKNRPIGIIKDIHKVQKS